MALKCFIPKSQGFTNTMSLKKCQGPNHYVRPIKWIFNFKISDPNKNRSETIPNFENEHGVLFWGCFYFI